MRNSAVAWALAAGLLSLSQASALELGDRSAVDAGSVGDSIGSVGGAARDTSRAVGQAVPEVARDLLTPNSAAQPTEPEAGQFGDPSIISADPTTLVGRQLITSDAAVLGTVRAVQIGAAGEPEILIISLGEQEIRVPVELGTLSDEGIRLDASAADVRAFFELSPAPAPVAQGSDAAQTLSPLSQPPLTEQQDSMATDVPILPLENQVSLSEQGANVQMPASALPTKIANSDSGSLAPPDPVHVAFTTESDSTQKTEPSQPEDSRAPAPTLASLLVGPPLYGALLLVAMAGTLLASKRGREILRQSLPPHLHFGARSGRNAGAVIKRKRGTRKISAAAGLTAPPNYFSSGVARGQRFEGRVAGIAE